MNSFEKTAVVGAGAWGSALSIILSKNFKHVCVWAREKEIVDSVAAVRENSMFLPDIKIPANVEFSQDPAEVLKGAQMAYGSCRLNTSTLPRKTFLSISSAARLW